MTGRPTSADDLTSAGSLADLVRITEMLGIRRAQP